MTTTNDSALPLIFSFSEEAFAAGFGVNLHVKGRAIVYQEDGDFCIVGLTPAGITGHGDDLGAAYRSFRINFNDTLAELIYLTDDFESFRARALDMLAQPPAHLLALWATAVDRVKAGEAVERGIIKTMITALGLDTDCVKRHLPQLG